MRPRQVVRQAARKEEAGELAAPGALAAPGCDSPLSFALEARDRDAPRLVARAVETRSLLLAFQPVVPAGQATRPVFYEGLIRILDDGGRIIPARDFMGAVESQELGRRIDCLSLDYGLQILRRHGGLRLSVNMSARSIGYPDWRGLLDAGLSAAPGLGERLILEIDEASAMLMPELVQVFMGEMHERGVSFALDGFGAGAVSLRHLRQLYFDILKIDGALVRGLARSPDDQLLMRAILSLARHFDMITVAESVETAEDAKVAERLGVDCLQGYFFGAPTVRPRWAPGEGPGLP